MGYRLSSVTAVSPNDTHAYYIYYISARGYEFNWVNEWIGANFDKIAADLGPTGVIIAPTPNNDENYLQSLLELNGGGCFFYGVYPEVVGKPAERNGRFLEQENVLHSGSPFFLFSVVPLHKDAEAVYTILIDLSACPDESTLARVVDGLVKTIKSESTDLTSKLPDLTPKVDEEEYVDRFNSFVKIKPGISGLSLDFNYLIGELDKLIRAKT